MKHILVAADGSPGADRAIDAAAALAKALSAELLIATVDEGKPCEDLSAFSYAENINEAEARDAEVSAILHRARERVAERGLSAVRLSALTGNAAEQLLECAKQEGVDVIVIGKRGRGRLAGMLLGSVSQKLVTLAPCHVIVVP